MYLYVCEDSETVDNIYMSICMKYMSILMYTYMKISYN